MNTPFSIIHNEIVETSLKSKSITSTQVKQLLSKEVFSLQDLPILLSPAAAEHIETIAALANTLSKKRFGNTIQIFVPMYLSNLCYNKCTYCDFSIDNKVKRIVLSDEKIVEEAKILSKKGFKHILLLTGEAEPTVGPDYISNAIKLMSPYFSSVGIEVQPLTKEGYQQVFDAGCDSITLYQETYNKDAYKKFHVSGKKKNYTKRLEAAETSASVGFHKMQIGALLGLYDWQYEAFSLAQHLNFMKKKYWKTKFGISFNRIKDISSGFKPDYPLSDRELVQLITSFRLVFPDVGISMSTREPASLRTNLIPLGITQMSAESKTSPGGYSGETELEQFSISDESSISAVIQSIKNKGYDPVFKDWDLCMT
ncbi:2-iminoacetate synthase ThiH [bacterium]|nr:2-iminoacetate synthase ThiH [bacterium]